MANPRRADRALPEPAMYPPPLTVHVCWFAHAHADPRCSAVARHVYEILHRPLQDNAIQRPGIELPVAYGQSLPDLLDALEAGREPAARARLVIAILDAAAFHTEAAREAVRRWARPRPAVVFLPIVLGGAWHTELRDLSASPPILVDRLGPAEPDRRWALAIEVCLAAGRALLRSTANDPPPRPRVLLSYARGDDIRETEQRAAHLAAQLRDHARLDAWHDPSDRPAGDEFVRQLRDAHGQAIVLVIRTDRYAEPPDCALELLAAKQERAPIVTVLATRNGERVAPAYGGNHRTIPWRPDCALEVAARCVQAWLHGHHFAASATVALARAGLPSDANILPRAPELLDLVGLSGDGPRLIVHPDPPLPDGEALVLRTAHPDVRIATPTTLLGRVLLAQDPEPPLTGTTLAFSLSVPDDLPRLVDHRIGTGVTQDHLDDVVLSLVLATLRSGARIAYGGDFRKDQSYARFLADLHRAYGGLGTRPSAQLLCFLDGRDCPADSDQPAFDPIDVTVPPGAERWPELRHALWTLAMREAMAKRCTGRVVLGGKTRPATTAANDSGYRGPWPGLLEEAWRTLRNDRALYIAGGFGGVAARLAAMLSTGEVPPELTRAHHAGTPLAALAERLDRARTALAADGVDREALLILPDGRPADIEDLARLLLARWQRFTQGDSAAWPNELTVEENQRLFRTTDRGELTHLVFEGLRRLRRAPKGALQLPLQLALYCGDIASVPHIDAYAVTVTPGVPPVGASASLAPYLERSRGDVPARTPSLAIEPVRASELAGSHVMVAQLALPPSGQPIKAAAVKRIARDVARKANRLGVESIACAAFGATLGLPIADAARAIVAGAQAGRDRYPRKLVLCETDAVRYEQLRAVLGPDAVELRAGPPARDRVAGPVLHVDVDEPHAATAGRARVTLYLPNATDPVAPLHEHAIAPDTWHTWALRPLQFADTVQMGRDLWTDLLSQNMRDRLADHQDRPLVVIGDEASARIPWELLADGDRPRPGGVVRRIALSGDCRSPGPQVERSRLRVLVVANPRGDLPGAIREADAVCEALCGRADVLVERLDGPRATLAAVAGKLKPGHHDVFHFAGHAHFCSDDPSRSGIALADGMLAANSLPQLVPQLVILNACSSGRMRDVGTAAPQPHAGGRSLAEAFLRAGVRGFIATFHSVMDENACRFAASVHRELAAGHALGTAMCAARDALYQAECADWGAFQLYGDGGLIL